MAFRRYGKLGAFIIALATVSLYLLLPGDVETIESTSLITQLVTNLNKIRCSISDRCACIATACLYITSLSVGQFYETVFRVCLSSEFNSFGSDRIDEATPSLNLVVVACGDRLDETLVNIKSSILFTSEKITYHIFAEDSLHEGFERGIASWPLHYRKNLRYKLYPITYPDDGNSENWKKLFKPCASQRLFLPLVLQDDVDSVLYVDTDILFLSDVKEFWNFFDQFDSTQLASLCIEHEDKRMGWYNRFARHPYFGESGVNSGVMLMNLTRMRKARYKNDLTVSKMKWQEMLLPLYKKYKYNITWGDQDLLNIIFHHNPEMLHVFVCKWNYRPDHCMYGQLCKSAASEGVKIVHGSRGVYHDNKQPVFKAVYKAIQSYNFQSDTWTHLYQVMRSHLKNTENTYCGRESNCILKGLQNSINKRVDQSVRP